LNSKKIGRNVQELIGVQKKLKIINKIAAEQVKRDNAKKGRVRFSRHHSNFENNF
jgi:hypothetical protein